MKTKNVFAAILFATAISVLTSTEVLGQFFSDSTTNYFTITAYYDAFYDSVIQSRGIENMQGTGYKDYLRWKRFYCTRHDGDGDISSIWQGITDYYENENPSYVSDNSDWKFIGPLGIPLGPNHINRGQTGKGMMISIWVDPQDANHILAGGHHGGLWKTQDKGQNWFPLMDNEPRLHGINSIAVDPRNKNIIYVTGTNTMSEVSSYSAGLFKSSDGGNSWNAINISGPAYPTANSNNECRKIIIHPNHPDTLLFISGRSLVISPDNGTNWETVFHKQYYWWADTGDGFFNHNGLFDGAVSTLFDSVIYIAGSEVFQVHLSPNGPADTVNISSAVFKAGLTSTDSLLSHAGRTGISVDGHFPGIVWFCYSAYYSMNGVDSTYFRITRFSEIDSSYTLMYEGFNNTASTPNITSSKLVFNVSPSDDSIFYVGGTYIKEIQIFPQGDSLFSISSGAYPDSSFIHVDMRAMKVRSDGSGHDTLYVANDGGISWATQFETGQGSQNEWYWRQACESKINGLDVTEFYAFGASPEAPYLLAGGCQDLSNMLLNGNEWINFGSGDGSDVIFEPENPNIMYFFEWQAGFYYRTNDQGIHCSTFYTPNVPTNYVMTPMVLDPINPGVLYGGSLADLMLFSEVNVFPGEPDIQTLYTFSDNISDIEVLDKGYNQKQFYITTIKSYSYDTVSPSNFTGCIYKGNNSNGTSFTDISHGLIACKDGFVCDIETDPQDYQKLWVACAWFSQDPIALDKVYYSDDSGSSWESYSNGLPPGLPVYKIKLVPEIHTLFAATDVGVFTRMIGDTSWIPFNNGLPRKIITDLEVNIPYNKIIASTYGRGIWESSLYCPHNDTTLVIASEVTWEEDMFMDRQVMIDSGGVLTIQGCTVSFPSRVKLIVMRGGKLVLDSAYLTTYCMLPWGGIEAWGDPEYSQLEVEHFGSVEMINGSIIENAFTGILTGRTDPYDHYYDNYSGGIVRIQESSFLNNQTAIEILPFRNIHPVYDVEIRYNANIYHSQFITDKDLLNSTPFEEFVKMTQVYGVDIRGCDFINERPAGIDFPDRGKGIYCLSAQFYVDDYCLNPNIFPCQSLKSCSFEGLQYGIKALNEGSGKTCSINNADFIENHTGIYLSVTDYSILTRNSFKISSVYSGHSDTLCGMYLDYCTGYQVEENDFVGTKSPSPLMPATKELGIVINNSGELSNEIYNNVFDSLYVGIIALDQNRNKDGRIGLQIKCNDFTTCRFDISVEKSDSTNSNMGIKENQGYQGTSPTDPANNTFGWVNMPQSDYYNNGENIVYWHLDTTLTSAHIKPRYYSYNVNPQHDVLNTSEFIKDTCCPSNLDTIGGGTGVNDEKLDMALAESQADSIQQIIFSLVDGGSTEDLTLTIQNSNPEDAFILYDQLNENSPYLSDSSMIAAIQKEDVLSSSLITDILTDNPQSAKSDTVQQALDVRSNQLSENQRILIDQGWFTIGAKEALESELSGLRAKQYSSLNKILRQYKKDTLLSTASDSIGLLLSLENAIVYKYMLAFEYLSKHDTSSARNVLAAILNNYSLTLSEEQQHQKVEDYIDWLIDLHSQNQSILIADSIKIAGLVDILAGSKGLLRMMVTNQLLYSGELTYHEPYIFLAETFKSGRIRRTKTLDLTEGWWFRIYPNPANNYCILEYKKNSKMDASIQLIDINGRIIKQVELTKDSDRILINLIDIPTGIYLFRLTGQGVQYGIQKIVIH